MNVPKIALLAGLICASVFAQPTPDPSVYLQITRVYDITSISAFVEGICQVFPISYDNSGGCIATVEYGNTVGNFKPFDPGFNGQIGLGVNNTIGRVVAQPTDLKPGSLVFVRLAVHFYGFTNYSSVVVFRTPVTDTPTARLSVELTESCKVEQVCIGRMTWSTENTPFASVFTSSAASPTDKDFILVGTAEHCRDCIVPLEKGKVYTFALYTNRTRENNGHPDGLQLAQYIVRIE